jgi:segregation and condensation protein B
MEKDMTEENKMCPESENQDNLNPESESAAKPVPFEEDQPLEIQGAAVEKSEETAAPVEMAQPSDPTGSAAQPEEHADSEEEEDDEPELIEGEFDTNLESVVEALLFAGDEPLSAAKLVEIAEAGSIKTIRKAVKTLNKKYRQTKSAFRIEELAGGYQMMTLACFNPWLSKLIKVRSDNKLSPAQLETLAIVAYKQPIIRADVEAIRGVATGEILRNLMYKGLVKIVGRAEILGRPMLYGTTKKFLDIFGLSNLKDLPKIEELKNPEKG